MNKEEIEQAKGHLGWLLDNGILTSEDEPHIENILKYIQQLELNVEALEMEHNHDIAMIDEAKGNAVKWSKERDNLKAILDKVTEECRKQMTTYEDSILEIFPQKILNIIEGEKAKRFMQEVDEEV